MIDETNLRKRLSADIARGIRSNDVIGRSVARIDMYQTLDTIKVDTVNKNVYEIVSEILTLCYQQIPVYWEGGPSRYTSGRVPFAQMGGSMPYIIRARL